MKFYQKRNKKNKKNKRNEGRKAVGVDEIPAEMLRGLEKMNPKKFVSFVKVCMKKENGQITSQEFL